MAWPWLIIGALPVLLLLLYLIFGLDPIAGVWCGHLFLNNDFFNYMLPTMTVIQKALLGGEFPWWNPYLGGGLPLYTEGGKPLLELLLLFLFSPATTIVLIAYLHVFAALALFYIFARELGLSREASLLGGLLWSLNGYHAWYLYDLSILGTNLWLPFLLTCLLRLRRWEGNPLPLLVGGAMAMGLQASYGRTTDFVYGLALLLAFAWFAAWRGAGEGQALGRWRHLAGSTGVWAVMAGGGAMLAAGFLLPFAINLLGSDRYAGAAQALTAYRSYGSAMEFFLPNLVRPLSRLLSLSPVGGSGHSMLFLGLISLPFILAAWRAKEDRYRQFFFAALVVPIFFLFRVPKTNIGLFDLLRLLPLHEGAAQPIRLLPITVLAASYLAARGFDTLLPTQGPARPTAGMRWLLLRGPLWLGGPLLAMLLTLSVWQGDYWPLVAIVALSWAGLAVAWAAVRGRLGRSAAFAAVFAVLLVNLFIANQSDRSDGDPRDMIHQHLRLEPGLVTVQYLRRLPSDPPFRVWSLSRFRKAFWERYLIPTMSAYGPIIPERPSRWQSRLRQSFFADLKKGRGQDHASSSRVWLDLSNVTYLAVKDSLGPPPASGDYHLVLRDQPARATLYRNPGARPRLYLASGYKVIAEDEQALDFMAERHSADPVWFRDKVVLATPPPQGFTPGPGPSKVSLRRYAYNRVDLASQSAQPSLLVFLDSLQAGWRAELDGRPVEILRANYMFRAIALPPGEHRLAFAYRPPGLYLGILITLGGLLAAGILLLVNWKRRGRCPA
ncbi:MAG: hypothetical protein C4525_07850 [Desulfarculus sp.]|nr:MAG: hypothetical protein C4525_07850 [Desulfarculus sp.]